MARTGYRPRPVTRPFTRFPSSRAGALAAWLVAAAALTAAGIAPAAAQPLSPATPPARDPTAAPPPAPPSGQLAIDAALEPYEGRPIRDIEVRGLVKTPRALVDNQIRSRAGSPLSVATVRGDVQRLVRLAGRFKDITAAAQPYADGTVTLIYSLTESPVIVDVQVVGNRQITDADLAAQVSFIQGTSVDEFQIGSAINRIQRLYRDKGYYLASVTIDQEELDERGIVLFRINEGDRVKVTDIRFEGNQAFTARQIAPNIKTETAGLFNAGPLDNEVLDRDVAQIVEFYKNRGYLDIRADRQVTFAPNGKEAIVTFLIDEGRLYTLRSVKVALMDNLGQPRRDEAGAMIQTDVLSREQIAGLMEIKAGDVFSFDKVRNSIESLRNGYFKMGYVDARISRAELRDEVMPEVDLLLLIREGRPYRAGLTRVKGNELTKSSVILRETEDIRPNRPLDMTTKRVGERQILDLEDRLNATRLFEQGSVRVTVQPEDPSLPGYRDVLLELRETDTGSIGFGTSLGSDAGVAAQISLRQDNFDLADTPDSFGEFIAGRAFRGGGQQFRIELSPGTEVSTYLLSLTDPAVFDTDYTAGGSIFFRERKYDEFDESRYGAAFSLGRRFGTRWAGNVNFRYNNIDISNIDNDAPQDLFDVQGESDLTGLGFKLTRTTVDSRFRPSKGTRIELGVERVGALGGDYEFTKLSATHQVFFTVDEDFFGRRTVLSFRTEASYIPEGNDEAPIFERYFLGGRTFRGFRFRTISPKGNRAGPPISDGGLTDDPVGGSWSFFFGPELERPVVDDFLAIAGFIDTGTVDEDVSFENYRVSAGIGIRLYIPQLSPAPLAFDFGFPIVKRFGDQERVFSFSIDLPF